MGEIDFFSGEADSAVLFLNGIVVLVILAFLFRIFNSYRPRLVSFFEICSPDNPHKLQHPHHVMSLVQATQCVVFEISVILQLVSIQWLHLSRLWTMAYFLFDLATVLASYYWANSSKKAFDRVYKLKERLNMLKDSDRDAATRITEENRMGMSKEDVNGTLIHHTVVALAMFDVVMNQGYGLLVVNVFNIGEVPLVFIHWRWFYSHRKTPTPLASDDLTEEQEDELVENELEEYHKHDHHHHHRDIETGLLSNGEEDSSGTDSEEDYEETDRLHSSMGPPNVSHWKKCKRFLVSAFMKRVVPWMPTAVSEIVLDLLQGEDDAQILAAMDKASASTYWLLRIPTFLLLAIVGVVFYVDWRNRWYVAILVLIGFGAVMVDQYDSGKRLLRRPYPHYYEWLEEMEKCMGQKIMQRATTANLKWHEVKDRSQQRKQKRHQHQAQRVRQPEARQ